MYSSGPAHLKKKKTRHKFMNSCVNNVLFLYMSCHLWISSWFTTDIIIHIGWGIRRKVHLDLVHLTEAWNRDFLNVSQWFSYVMLYLLIYGIHYLVSLRKDISKLLLSCTWWTEGLERIFIGIRESNANIFCLYL